MYSTLIFCPQNNVYDILWAKLSILVTESNMQFTSFIFILLFLPITILIYFSANKINSHIGKFALLASCIVFYCYSNIISVIAIVISLTLNYVFSLLIAKSKKWHSLYLSIPVFINVSVLLFYKYLDFTIMHYNYYFGKDIPIKKLMLPLGISFFTFQQIAYLVATYKKELDNNNLLDYLLFILYFPKLTMGPLMDPVDFISQINDSKLKTFNWDNLISGIKIFSFGLFKKVMLADVFARTVSWGYANFDTSTSLDWILIMLFYTFEIYFDFSGYSDMAIGASILLNITLPINFDSPYKSISIREFWRRWHISLNNFFIKYIYIPLGGSKKGLFFTCLNTMIIFFVSGMWHGSNWTYMLWGILNGVLSIVDKLADKYQAKIHKTIRWFFSFIIINFSMILFRSETIHQWLDILSKTISFQKLNISGGLISTFTLQESAFLNDLLRLNSITANPCAFWMCIYLLASFVICLLFENNYKKLHDNSWFMMIISAIAFVWGIISLCGESVFVYFYF